MYKDALTRSTTRRGRAIFSFLLFFFPSISVPTADFDYRGKTGEKTSFGSKITHRVDKDRESVEIRTF